MGLLELKRDFVWPKEKPNVKEDNHGWFSDPVKIKGLLGELNDKTKIIVELGSWLGQSTKILLNNAINASVISIDWWKGDPGENRKEILVRIPILYETFLVNCWEYKERLIPLKMTTLQGLKTVFLYNIEPDLILIDADDSYESTLMDLTFSYLLFPKARICGDDWTIKKEQNYPVNRAVNYFARKYKYEIELHSNLWILR